ncbi:MAG TPA: PaaI family thioesterase [Acidimicrobiales bacterium]|nr:PaaI family thioesterase [Acidimicrobiales bacterium]
MPQQDEIPRFVEVADAMKARDWDTATKLGRERVPLHNQMGLKVVDQEGNTVVMTMELSESVRGGAGAPIHGGILATFADVASATALFGSYDETTMAVTTDMHIRYYRQPRAGPLRAEATLVHRGQRLLSTECSIADAEGRILTRSTATYMLVPRPGSDLAAGTTP